VPLKRVSIPSPNYSSRGGSPVRLIVLHTTEGARTYQDLGAFFGRSSAQASSHVGIDDTAGVVGEYVAGSQKAWTQAKANPYSVSAEMCAFAKWAPSDWEKHPNMLKNAAAWVAEEAKAFGIPIVRLTAAQAQGGGRGICQHYDLGAAGGGHWDCGPGFPMDRVLEMAKGGGASPSGAQPPSPAPATERRVPTPGPDPARTTSAPPFPGRVLRQGVSGTDVKQWQQKMCDRGWGIVADGVYGQVSARTCKSFQAEKSLPINGEVGPETWAAAWVAAVT
jgi:N-acetylmuramoyl-L-alanine amidase/Putative peptidoglycan binding domain